MAWFIAALLHVLLPFCCFILAEATANPPRNMSACSTRCGQVSIPFPFGIEEGCYLDEHYLVICNSTDQKAYLAQSIIISYQGAIIIDENANTSIEVLDILLDGRLRVSIPVAYECYNRSGNWISTMAYEIFSNFSMSNELNMLTAVGCQASASLGTNVEVPADHVWSTTCARMADIANGSCSGAGCAQDFLPPNLRSFGISAWSNDSSAKSHSVFFNISPCSYAFIVEQGKYNFSSVDLANLRNMQQFPAVFEWTISNTTCETAKRKPETYACVSDNSFCYDPPEALGYRCSCSQGFQGNPYLPHACQDINECEDSNLNQCLHKGLCINTVGNYTCYCPKGQLGDGRKDGQGCTFNKSRWIKEVVAVSITIGAVLGTIFLLSYRIIRKSNIRMVREKRFKENGGPLLRQLLSGVDQSTPRSRIFTERELEKATDSFKEDGIVGRGGNAVVYRGISVDGTIVAIKKPAIADRGQIELFVNEVIILSRMNHPNLVKLFGCCLETEAPSLVYEFICNNTLYHHLHDPSHISSLSWKQRLAIAAETAGALAYMHFETSMQIVHRDIKSKNILLDENFTAKISDFGISRLLPSPFHFTIVQGTLGYIDPQYFDTGMLTDKSDVYSFGVVLAELLTGKYALFHDTERCKDQNLATHFVSSVNNGELFQILEERIKNEGEEKQLTRVAELTKRCLSRVGEERPTMKDVREELQEVKS